MPQQTESVAASTDTPLSGSGFGTAYRRLFAGRLSLSERALMALAGVCILLAIAQPIWWIHLSGPQYPDGLNVFIHAQRFSGDIRSVNTLNHYIGMKPLSVKAFPEFQWLPTLLAVIGSVHLLAALIGRRHAVLPAWLLLIGFKLFMLVDMGLWLYEWGHNLSPRAAIKVLPFMPPLLGFKRLANFVVVSMPAFGGALLMVAAGVGLLLTGMAVRRGRPRVTTPA